MATKYVPVVAIEYVHQDNMIDSDKNAVIWL